MRRLPLGDVGSALRLVVYRHPKIIWVATAASTAHHLTLWLLVRESLWNAAHFWVVAGHALFVLLESVAACYIAKSLYDIVTGKERVLEERTPALDAQNSELRLVLDHVEEGLATVDRHGNLAPERSRAFDRLLHAEGRTVMADILGAQSPSAGEMFRLVWPDLTSGCMPIESTLQLLPKRIDLEGHTLGLSYSPIVGPNGEFDRCLVVVADRTAVLEQEKLVEAQTELFTVVDRMGRDREGFQNFLDDARDQMAVLTEMVEPADLSIERRLLHTLKGNAAFFGLKRLAHRCHEIETRMVEGRRGLLEADKLALSDALTGIVTVSNQLAGRRRKLERVPDIDRLLAMLEARAPHEEIRKLVRTWRLEPVRRHLERAASQAQGLARQLGKEPLAIQIEDNALRLPSPAWSSFFSSLTHVVRNAVDHGIEDARLRASLGKPENGSLMFETVLEDGEFIVRCTDDGRGIDLGRIAMRASRLGIPLERESDLLSAIFADGISTVEEVSEVSGRGVGMGAVRAECERLGGFVEVGSTMGSGTRFTFRFPLRSLRESLRPAAAQGESR